MASPTPFDLDLVPPFLAHLPGAHISAKPSESLYPLLAPLLRQRLRLLSSPSQTDPWLALLSWTPSRGSQLVAHCSKLDITPHPVSGEVEAGPVRFSGYRRVDAETLEGAVELPELGIEMVYNWIIVDPDFECQGDWKIMDVHTSTEDGHVERLLTIFAAEETFRKLMSGTNAANTTASKLSSQSAPAHDDEDDDDDYWNSYDTADSHTPAASKQPVPSEEEYFSRFYGEHNEDPNAYDSAGEHFSPQPSPRFRSSEPATETSSPPTASPTMSQQAPQALPPLFDVSKFEESATRMDQEIAIKQHVSTTMKSLYRLAKATGIEREEFEAMIQTELSILPMLDDE